MINCCLSWRFLWLPILLFKNFNVFCVSDLDYLCATSSSNQPSFGYPCDFDTFFPPPLCVLLKPFTHFFTQNFRIFSWFSAQNYTIWESWKKQTTQACVIRYLMFGFECLSDVSNVYFCHVSMLTKKLWNLQFLHFVLLFCTSNESQVITTYVKMSTLNCDIDVSNSVYNVHS